MITWHAKKRFWERVMGVEPEDITEEFIKEHYFESSEMIKVLLKKATLVYTGNLKTLSKDDNSIFNYYVNGALIIVTDESNTVVTMYRRKSDKHNKIFIETIDRLKGEIESINTEANKLKAIRSGYRALYKSNIADPVVLRELVDNITINIGELLRKRDSLTIKLKITAKSFLFGKQIPDNDAILKIYKTQLLKSDLFSQKHFDMVENYILNII